MYNNNTNVYTLNIIPYLQLKVNMVLYVYYILGGIPLEWLNENINTSNERSFCVIRSCNDKNYCEDYFCLFLYCKTNN